MVIEGANRSMNVSSDSGSGRSKIPGKAFMTCGEYHLKLQTNEQGDRWMKAELRFGISCKTRAFPSKMTARANGPFAKPQYP